MTFVTKQYFLCFCFHFRFPLLSFNSAKSTCPMHSTWCARVVCSINRGHVGHACWTVLSIAMCVHFVLFCGLWLCYAQSHSDEGHFNIPFLILKVRYPAISYVVGFSLLLGVVIEMNSNATAPCSISACELA